MTICVGRDHWARRPPGLFRHFASVGEGLAPPAGFVPHRLIWGTFRRSGGEWLSERSESHQRIAGVCSDGQAASISKWMWPVHSHCTPDPVYGRAWYENPAQMYRRGVASDASPFSRPLPLCGKTRELSVLPT